MAGVNTFGAGAGLAAAASAIHRCPVRRSVVEAVHPLRGIGPLPPVGRAACRQRTAVTQAKIIGWREHNSDPKKMTRRKRTEWPSSCFCVHVFKKKSAQKHHLKIWNLWNIWHLGDLLTIQAKKMTGNKGDMQKDGEFRVWKINFGKLQSSLKMVVMLRIFQRKGDPISKKNNDAGFLGVFLRFLK